MVSATQQSSRIRARKARRAGAKRKRHARAHGTPAFPVHQVGLEAGNPGDRIDRKADVAK